MPDKRCHRGPHPEDARLFASEQLPVLRRAVRDLSWLLTEGYAPAASLKLVGDRFGLEKRQRIAVARCACSDQQRADRRRREAPPEAVSGRPLWIDGYNVLTSVEAALAGAVILGARDGCCRDMASVHGTYRRVMETTPAIELLGEALAQWRPSTCRWLLDSPVSNSGRLKGWLEDAARRRGWPWTVELVPDPDAVLGSADVLVATSDSVVLDHCGRWVNLVRHVIQAQAHRAWFVDLACETTWRAGENRR